jgi:hypothetical protein
VDPDALRTITDVGTVGLLILVLVGGFRAWWIYGPLHDRIVRDLVADRDFWRDMALRGVALAERAADAALADLAVHAAEREGREKRDA